MKKVLTAIVTAIFSVCLVVATVTSVSAAAKLKKVANFKASATPVAVTLTWSKSSDAKTYEIQQKSGSKWKAVTTIKKAQTTTYTVKKLKNGTTYQFRIRAVNGKKTGPYVTVKIKTGVEAIKFFTGASTGLKSVKLTWAKANVNGYVIQQKVGNKWKNIKTIKKAATTSVSVTGLPAAKATSFRIRGYVNGTAKTYEGAFTKAINVTTAVTPMKSVAFKNVTYNSAVVTWAKLSGVTGYQVQKLQSGKWVDVNKAVKNSVVQYTVTGLASCAQNQIRVRAYQNDGGKPYYNAWVTVRPTTPIGSVTGFAGPSYLNNNATAKLTWKAAPGAKTYRVFNNNVKLFDVSALYANIAVEANKTYKISVAPVNGNTVGAKTSVITFTTPCAQVKNVSVTSITDDSVSLAWDATPGAVSYRIEYSENGTSWKSVTADKNSAAVEYLKKDTEYKFRVSAANKNGVNLQYGKASDILTKSTPAGVTAAAVSGGTKLTWEKIDGAVSYKVQRYVVNKNEWTDTATVLSEEFICENEKTNTYRVVGLDAQGKVIYTSDIVTVAGVGQSFVMDSYGVTFSWAAVNNATSYKIVTSAQDQTIETKTVGTSVRSCSLILAPETFYEIDVYAVVSGKSPVVEQFAVETAKININDNTDSGINAKLLYLAESINRTKYDNSIITELTLYSETRNKMTYMEFSILDAEALGPVLQLALGSAFKGLRKGVDYDIEDGGIKCYNEKAVSALLNFIDGSGDSNNVVETSTVKGVFNDPKSGYSAGGLGDITVTDKNGKVTKKAGYLNDTIQPAGKRAYIYNSNNPSAWRNGFESVTMSETADGYEMKVVLKVEKSDTSSGKKAEYHAGLVNAIGNTSISFGGDDEDTKTSTETGKTTIIAKIDKSGKLVSYDVNTSYKMGMDSTMAIPLTDDANGSSIKFKMAMDLQGSDTYNTVFKRYSK